jgi:single-strand DNA-binding protein
MNRVMLMGNIGAEPEVRTLQNGNVVASARLATTKKGYTTANGTKVEDVTYWHSLILWGKKAELMRDYVHKGDKLVIEGELQYRKYTNKQGAEVEVTEINVTDMWFASRKQQGAAPQGQAPAPQAAPVQAPPTPQFAPTAAPAPAPNNYQAAAPQTPPAPSYTPPQAGNGWGGSPDPDDFPF